MGSGIGITDMDKAAREFDGLSPAMLELLERQTTAFLYALWKARGIDKRIVKVGECGSGTGELAERSGA